MFLKCGLIVVFTLLVIDIESGEYTLFGVVGLEGDRTFQKGERVGSVWRKSNGMVKMESGAISIKSSNVIALARWLVVFWKCMMSCIARRDWVIDGGF